MAVTDFQVLLNDHQIKHKASLLLYDEICHLFKDYIFSPNFDRFAKFKSRSSLLTSTQKTFNSKALLPNNGNVRLHNIEMMEAESKVIVNWSYYYQIVKGGSDKYNLNKDYVKVLNIRLCSSIWTIVTGFTKSTITSTSGELCSSMHTLASKDTNGMIGHLLIFKK
jgi:hypothetical protein